MHSERAHHLAALNDGSLGVDAFLQLAGVHWGVRDGELLGLLVGGMSMPVRACSIRMPSSLSPCQSIA